jgi:hypothetical protein
VPSRGKFLTDAEFCKFLDRLREALEMDDSEWAGFLGLSRNQLLNLKLRGKSPPVLSMVPLIKFGINMTDLASGQVNLMRVKRLGRKAKSKS